MDEALDHDVMALVKGKQMKRQRLRSQSKEGDIGINKALTVVDESSPLTSSVEYNCEGTVMTEAEVDMAICLILLAQGHCPKQPAVKLSASADDDQEYGRFTSRKYLETDSGPGKKGYYVYERKTCKRTFPSFQALGGHRASHKKSKSKSTPNPTVAIPLPDEEGQPGESKKYSSLSLQIGNNSNGGSNSYGHSNNSTNNLGQQRKVHKCSICGAEFGSGQALGGHMRRHRAPPTTPQIGIPRLVDTTTISLNLDLNLPAPEDRNAGNVFILKQHERQSPAVALALSSPAMVDCHY